MYAFSVVHPCTILKYSPKGDGVNPTPPSIKICHGWQSQKDAPQVAREYEQVNLNRLTLKSFFVISCNLYH